MQYNILDKFYDGYMLVISTAFHPILFDFFAWTMGIVLGLCVLVMILGSILGFVTLLLTLLENSLRKSNE